MSNRFGQAYGLTALSPILSADDETGTPHDLALRDDLRQISLAPESPFASVPTTHLARWTVIDEAPFESLPAKVDHLRSKYLMFTSNFDGGGDSDDVALARYIESLRTSIPSVIERLYRRCVGFPGARDPLTFLEYFKECQVKTTFLFGAYPEGSVDQVLRALVAQRRMAAFVADQQDARSTPAQLQAAFRELQSSLANAPTPRPGSYL